MRFRQVLVAGALGVLPLAACQPDEPFVDILRVDCTQPGWFSVQTSATDGTLELQTGTGYVVWEGPAKSLQRSTVRDWHPTRGGHVEKLRAVLDARLSSGNTATPLCGVTLKPE